MLEKSFLAHSYKCCILVLSAVTGHLGFLGIASLFLQSTQRPRIRIYFIAVHDGKPQPNPNQLPTEWFQVAIVYPLIGFQVLRSDGSSETRGLNRFESAWTPFRSFSPRPVFPSSWRSTYALPASTAAASAVSTGLTRWLTSWSL